MRLKRTILRRIYGGVQSREGSELRQEDGVVKKVLSCLGKRKTFEKMNGGKVKVKKWRLRERKAEV